MIEQDTSTEPVWNLAGLPLPRSVLISLVVTTTLITFDFYYDVLNRFLPSTDPGGAYFYKALDRFFMYLVIPLGIIVLIERRRPADYGFRLGNWRVGMRWVLLTWIVATPVLIYAASTTEVNLYYQQFKQPTVAMLLLAVAFDLVGWEFMFRGWLLNALERVAGPSAVVLQAVPFALAHLGKPPAEALSTIFSGIAFGWLAWRTGSFLYPFLIHIYILFLVTLLV